MRPRGRRIVALVAAILGGLLLVGLLQVVPSWLPASALVGTWTHEQDGDLASIELRGDGTFIAENLPKAVVTLYGSPGFGDDIDWTKTVSGKGIWWVDAGSVQLVLQAGAAQGWGSSAAVGGWPWAPQLSIRFGDAEFGLTFDFARGECCSFG